METVALVRCEQYDDALVKEKLTEAFALLGGFFSRTFMALQTDVPEIIAYGDTYLTIIAVASVGMVISNILR